MNRKKIFTKKKVTGAAALLVAIAIIVTGTFAWKDFSQSSLSLFSADAVSKHWVSLVDDFQSATNVATNTLTNWKRGNVANKEVYISSKPTNTKANPTEIMADPEDEYAPVYVRVKLTQELTIGDGASISDPKANSNSINQYPTYVKWNDNATIKTIDKWIDEEESKQGAYWVLDNTTGWLYWAEPLEFGAETAHLLDTVELLVELESDFTYTVDVTLEAVSSDLDSTTGTDDYLGGFKDWGIANDAPIMNLFMNPLVFTIDTTKTSGDKTLKLQVNADEGNNFAVDWGDGAVEEFTNEEVKDDLVIHDYETDDVYTVKIIGLMPSAMSFKGEKKLTAVQSGFLQNTASDMQQYFRDCRNLKTIPDNLFVKSPAVTNFYATFYLCEGLVSLPADLFKYNTKVTTFQDTFGASAVYSLPAGLFKYNTEVTTFGWTFMNRWNLKGSIPADLFKYNTKVTTFQGTFCQSALTSIPTGLFDNNPLVTEFTNTFLNYTKLTSIPALWESYPSVTNHLNTFEGCKNNSDAVANGWATNVTP